MATSPIYVPVLKGKEGEYGALEVLKADIKRRIMPLIEIPPVPYDYTSDRPAKSLDEHVRGIAERLRRSLYDVPLYLDMLWFGDQERLEDGRLAFEVVLADCARQSVIASPVISRGSSEGCISAAKKYSAQSGTGACIRLFVEDFDEDVDVSGEVDQILTKLGVHVGNLDLIIDLAVLGSEATRTLIARSVLSMIPRKQAWRRIILAATSFPEDLSDVDAQTVHSIPRHEWSLWKNLQRRPDTLPRRDIVFGDYAIAHPTPKEIDPRTMRMSASIRYTAKDSWLILKGRNVRQYGFDQYFELCKVLTGHSEYKGPEFSWGDRYIADCADGITGPGNATTWRKVGTNHHITLVVKDLATLSPGA